MSTDYEKIKVSNFEVDVIRKDIKNMHLAVYPPTGRIRLSAPTSANAEMVRLFAISKISWIKKHIKNFNDQPRETRRTYQNGESHYFLGKRYLLKVYEKPGASEVKIGNTKILLFVKDATNAALKANNMKEWYRSQLKLILPSLISKWEKEIGVKSNDWAVKQMRTKWGACNTEEKRIWLNLELVKKPLICIEYIIVHELVHLLERNHNENFVRHMDNFMPKWRHHRNELNQLPVAHTDWEY